MGHVRSDACGEADAVSARGERKEQEGGGEGRAKSHTASDTTKDKRRSLFGRLWEHSHHEHVHIQDPSSSTYAGHPAYAEPARGRAGAGAGTGGQAESGRHGPHYKIQLLAPPKKKKKEKELTTLAEAAKALPALHEESEPPSPISQRGLMDLAEILAETPPTRIVRDAPGPAHPAPATAGLAEADPERALTGTSTPERLPSTPPATPFAPETEPRRAVDQLTPILEMDHALALSQAVFTPSSEPSDPSESANPATEASDPTSSSTPAAPSRAEPATPPATPMPQAPIQRDFAYHRGAVSFS
ncbi:hypothetical protein CC85DRAFT_163769 [Cutaneotrichosporon oleaginosum]|uniref:Uncharacterized protein n=1 Tax=Cutaneotrichosporon oleaginosum TaxID=879819 RepID=A0A0J0XGB8_9TREE|nr:uncharacterized protein CC85DRAFT_163769 [Cutaneotrichosporon oleaginosum]KLT40135.1 hypothetical protein CC85DRAFT_163769 [Cutaneotrichosporon oleaginosum]TXT04773.1 hypothetical protein COLE_07592 [Cutaneotrichosporon oleaginosum]